MGIERKGILYYTAGALILIVLSLLFDEQLFRLTNNYSQNFLFDFLMPFINKKYFLHILIFLISILIIYFRCKKGIHQALLSLFGYFIIGGISSTLLKLIIQRVRPCNALDSVRLVSGIGCPEITSFSFPSTHATMSFVIAGYLSMNFPKAKIFLIIFASVVAFSRVYLGVHYPSDVIIGSIIGYVLGIFLFYISGYFDKFLKFNL